MSIYFNCGKNFFFKLKAGGHAQPVPARCPCFPTSVFLSHSCGNWDMLASGLFWEGMMKVSPTSIETIISHTCFKTLPDLMDFWLLWIALKLSFLLCLSFILVT